jgi:hypothetical protein
MFGGFGLTGQNIGHKEGETYVSRDIVRVPFQAHRTYQMKVLKGSVSVIELPLGEIVKNIWLNRQWFMAESISGSGRITVTALAAENVEGQRTMMHVETSTDLRISVLLECVPYDVEMPPSVLQFYLTGQEEDIARQKMISRRADEIASARADLIEEKFKANFEQWKTEALNRINMDYVISGNMYVSKVIDDCVQTFIYVTGVNELASLRFVNRDKQEEVVNFEFLNDAYVVNRVLVAGEQFILTVGRDRTTIKRK